MNRTVSGLVQNFGISCALVALVYSQGGTPAGARIGQTDPSRQAQLVEANVIATHAYQVLLAKRSGKSDAVCYQTRKLSDGELEALAEHQGKLLKSDIAALRTWVRHGQSSFDPADGDRLQEEFAFYIGLGLPVYVGQLNLPGSDGAMLAVGQQLAAQTCVSPFETNAAAWQIAGRKIWNWGEKNLHIRDERVLASELLSEPDVKILLPRLRELPAQRIAVIGHSFTMGLHWSSPSSFVPIVIDIFRRENPRVEFKQFAAGGLTASRAKQRFYQSVLDWKPDKVLLVVMTRTGEDYDALKQLGEGFGASGIKTSMFDELHDPESVKPGTVERAVKVARAAGIEIIEVGNTLSAAPDRAKFVCLDGTHMTEPYHRLMAKEWLKFLVSAQEAKQKVASGPP